MEEKRLKRQNSLWSIFGIRRNNSFLFGRQNGFTLVELLIVIGVLSIIVSAVLLILNPFTQVQKGNDARRKSDLSQIQKALETYYQDSGRYPAHSSTPAYRIIRLDGSTANWGESFSPYMTTLPKDPKGNYKYTYFASSNGQSFWLYASLERPSDPQTCGGGNPCASLTSNGVPDSSCGGICNYAITSPNVSP